MATDLAIHIEKQGNAFSIRAVSALDTSTFTIDSQTGVVRKLEQIYELIEPRPEAAGTLDKVGDFMEKQARTVRDMIPFLKSDQKATAPQDTPLEIETLNRLLAETGGLLFDPIEPLVAIASSIEFVVADDCLFYPFDVLHVGENPLFLKKPVAYSLSKKETDGVRAAADWRGLIVADTDTDPEKGATAVAASFPGAFGFDASHVRRQDIAGISSVDFILISAEGGLDGLKMADFVLRPEILSRLRPELVYIDCDLYGLNLNFLNHFSHSGVAAYVAPIFSRQPGEASAQTMIRFFRTMLTGERPSRALYLARKTLYDAHILKGENELAALRSAFPFRVYRLN
jgi:hypothetical protein